MERTKRKRTQCPTLVARSNLDFSSGPFSATFVQYYGPFFPWQNLIFNITFWIFFAKFSTAWQHGRCDRSAAYSTQWQDLELHFTTRRVCISDTSGSVDARVCETHVSTKQYVSVYETKANTLQLVVAVFHMLSFFTRSPLPYHHSWASLIENLAAEDP